MAGDNQSELGQVVPRGESLLPKPQFDPTKAGTPSSTAPDGTPKLYQSDQTSDPNKFVEVAEKTTFNTSPVPQKPRSWWNKLLGKK